MRRLLAGIILLGLTAPLAASQIQRTEPFELPVLCTRTLFYPAENLRLPAEVVPCPADPTLCDRFLVLADGTEVTGCPGPFIVTTRTVAPAPCGQPYIAWFAALDAIDPPVTFTPTPDSTLPPGLTFNPDGSITGTVPFSAPECQNNPSGMVAVNLRGMK